MLGLEWVGEVRFVSRSLGSSAAAQRGGRLVCSALMLAALVLGGCGNSDDVGAEAELLIDTQVSDVTVDGAELYWTADDGLHMRAADGGQQTLWDGGRAEAVTHAGDELLWIGTPDNSGNNSTVRLQPKAGGEATVLEPDEYQGTPYLLAFSPTRYAAAYRHDLADTLLLGKPTDQVSIGGDVTGMALDGDTVFYTDNEAVYRLTDDGPEQLAQVPFYDHWRSVVVSDTHVFTVRQAVLSDPVEVVAVPREGGEPTQLVAGPPGCGSLEMRNLVFDGSHIYFRATLEVRDDRCFGQTALHRVTPSGDVETVWARFTGYGLDTLFAVDDTYVYLGGSHAGQFFDGIYRVPKNPE